MNARGSSLRALWPVAFLLVPACVSVHLDAIGTTSGAIDAEAIDAAVDSQILDSASEREVTADVIDSSDEGAVEAEASAGDGAAAPTPCASVATPIREWTFDANTEGWTVLTDTGTTGVLSWASTMGNPPGALQFDVTPGTRKGAWLRFVTPLGNLTQRIASAWVWLDSGTSPHLKLFVQTGSTYSWADGGTVVLTPRAWTCVSLDLSAPQYNQPNYDPMNVVAVGFETQGVDPFRLYVDDVRYQ